MHNTNVIVLNPSFVYSRRFFFGFYFYMTCNKNIDKLRWICYTKHVINNIIRMAKL